MNRSIKALFVAVGLVVTGGILAGCSLFAMGGSFQAVTGMHKPIQTVDYIEEHFSKVEIEYDTLDVTFFPSEDGTCYYVAKTYNNMFCDAKVENDTLIIGQNDGRKWYQHIGFFWGKTSLEVYLPKSTYDRLTLSGHTGNVTIGDDFSFDTVRITTTTGNVNISAAVTELLDIQSTTGNINILSSSPKTLTVECTTGNCFMRGINVQEELSAKTSTGNIGLIDVACGELELRTSTGNGELENVIAAGNATLHSSTGDWELNGFDAANITMNTATGDVEGTLLSEKIFLTDTNTGDVDVPRTTTGGKCEITTDTGDIEIDIAP